MSVTNSAGIFPVRFFARPNRAVVLWPFLPYATSRDIQRGVPVSIIRNRYFFLEFLSLRLRFLPLFLSQDIRILSAQNRSPTRIGKSHRYGYIIRTNFAIYWYCLVYDTLSWNEIRLTSLKINVLD